MIQEMYAVLERIKNTSSRIEKEEIIKEFEDSSNILNIFYFLFNDFVTTGLDVKKIDKEVGVQRDKEFRGSLIDVFNYLDIFNTGSDIVIANIQHFIKTNATNKNEKEFLKQLFTKTYKAGVTAKTVNKALGRKFIPEFNVQLAHPYEKYGHKIEGDFAITIKLDGNRMLAIVDEIGETTFFTRTGKPIEGLREIAEDIKAYANNSGILSRAEYNKGFVLDGEVLVKNSESSQEAFQETMKTVRKDGNKTGLDFWVFDILPLEEFQEGESKDMYLKRSRDLQTTFKRGSYKNIKLVGHLYVGDDKGVIPYYLEQAILNNEEGVMINLDTTYKCKRHAGILKVKEFKSADVLCKDVFEGQGKYEDSLGGIVIDWKGHKVKVGSGFTDDEREILWKNKDSIIGKIVEVQYFGESTNQKDDGISLRFPTFKGIREDKSVEDVNIE